MRGNDEANAFFAGLVLGLIVVGCLVVVFGRVSRKTIDTAILKCSGHVTEVYLRGSYNCEINESKVRGD